MAEKDKVTAGDPGLVGNSGAPGVQGPPGMTLEEMEAAREAEFQKKLEEMSEAALADARKQAETILAEATAKAATLEKTAPKLTAAEKKLQAANAEMAEKVKIRLFKDGERYKDDLFVSVNGIGYLIQRGVEVEVPRSVAQVIEQSLEQDQRAYMMMERLADEFEQESKKLS